ncbi:MAG: chain-length determining protein [Cellvibrio sp.]|jgi:protein-tyrosine kinase
MNNLAHATADDVQVPSARVKMGHMLVDTGKITAADLKAIIALQNERGIRFGEAALLLGLVSPADIRAVLARQFAYTSVPDSATRLAPTLTAVFRPESAEVEALRSLRSELMLRYFNTAPNQSLAVVGAEDAETIARTTANLAIVFSQMGMRTLLIDSNLRESQLHKLFGVDSRQPGLADLIADRARIQPLPVATLQSLWLLPAGTQAPNPQELLSGKNYREYIGELTRRFDVTLISTSPMSLNRDAQLVAAHAGAALLIAQQHSSRMKDLEALCTSLWGVGVRVVGAALRQ